jgi:hypothetical protein
VNVDIIPCYIQLHNCISYNNFSSPSSYSKLFSYKDCLKSTWHDELCIFSFWRRREKEQSSTFKTKLNSCCIPYHHHATLHSPMESSFALMLESDHGQDQTTHIGFDNTTFQDLHNLFANINNAFTPFSKFLDYPYLEVNSTINLVSLLILLTALQA